MVCKQREHVAGFHRESLRVCAGGYAHVGGSVRTCVYVNAIEKLVKCIRWTLISPHCYDSEATKNQRVHQLDFDFTPLLWLWSNKESKCQNMPFSNISPPFPHLLQKSNTRNPSTSHSLKSSWRSCPQIRWNCQRHQSMDGQPKPVTLNKQKLCYLILKFDPDCLTLPCCEQTLSNITLLWTDIV